MIQALLLKLAVSIFWHYEPQILTAVDTKAQAEAKKVIAAISAKL
jgi:hypothetical protein